MVAVPALIVLVLLGYASALWSDFAYDDYRLIVRNDALVAPGALLDSFRGDYYRSTLDVGRLGYYRPLSVALNVIDRRIWDLEARGYHLTNILLHLMAVVLLWFLLRRCLGPPWAWLAAALFALHPARAESVSFISGRVDLLAGAGFLGCLLLLTRRGGAGPRRGDLIVAAVLAAAAVLAKEMAVTIILVGPLLVLRLPALMVAAGGMEVQSTAPAGRPGWGDLAGARRTLVGLGLALGAVVLIRGIAMGGLSGHQLASPLSWPPRLIITMGEYLRTMLVPSWTLRLEPPLVIDGWTVAAIPAVLLLAAAIFAVVRLWRRVPAVAVGLLAGLLAMLPVAQLVPLETTWAERFSYIPAALTALALGGTAQWVAARWRRRGRLVILLLIGLLSLEGVFLWHRNLAWRDDETLWRTVMASGQISAKALNNRGVNLMERGELDQAAAAYQQALALDADLPTAHFNLGVVHWARGRLDDALHELRTATSLRPHDVDFALKLGTVAMMAGRFDEAGAVYRRLLELRPDDVPALLGLATTLRRQRQFDEALTVDRRALALAPDDLAARHGLASDQYGRGEFELSRRWCEEVLAAAPDYRPTRFLRGRIREAAGDLEGALVDYQAAAAHDQESVAAWVQAGRLLAMLERPCQGQAAFATAASLAANPDEATRLQQAATALAAACQGQ